MPDVRCSHCDFCCSVSRASHGEYFSRCVPGVARPKRSRKQGSVVTPEDAPLKILLYYSYVDVPEVDVALRWHKLLCEHLDLRGRVRASPEGLNVILDGGLPALECYCDAVQTHGCFGREIDFKVSDVQPGVQRFPKLSCRPASHVVEMGVENESARPEDGARHVDPDEWHAMLSQATTAPGSLEGDDDAGETVLFDVRNIYESRIGRFECTGAQTLAPDLRHFAQFPQYVDQHVGEFRGKRVMMYCTGGVRCERASSYLLSKTAAREVVQLKGGICRYLERFDGQQGYFRGKNFVFDYRRYEPRHDDTVVGRCDGCNAHWDDYDNGPEVRCKVCRTLMLLCDSCRHSRKESASDGSSQSAPEMLCGGSTCDGERIRCGCGCSPEFKAGPVCRRTGYFTRQSQSAICRQTGPPRRGDALKSDAADSMKRGRNEATCEPARSHGEDAATPPSFLGTMDKLHWCQVFAGTCWDGMFACPFAAWRREAQRPASRAPFLRRATLADMRSCIEVANAAYVAQYGTPRYRDEVAVRDVINRERMLVVTDGPHGKVLACAVHEEIVSREVLRFGPVAVFPSCQCRGLGSVLVSEIERLAVEASCQALQVEIRRHDRGRSIADFYTRRGYAPTGPRHRNYIVLSKTCNDGSEATPE